MNGESDKDFKSPPGGMPPAAKQNGSQRSQPPSRVPMERAARKMHKFYFLARSSSQVECAPSEIPAESQRYPDVNLTTDTHNFQPSSAVLPNLQQTSLTYHSVPPTVYTLPCFAGGSPRRHLKVWPHKECAEYACRWLCGFVQLPVSSVHLLWTLHVFSAARKGFSFFRLGWKTLSPLSKPSVVNYSQLNILLLQRLDLALTSP